MTIEEASHDLGCISQAITELVSGNRHDDSWARPKRLHGRELETIGSDAMARVDRTLTALNQIAAELVAAQDALECVEILNRLQKHKSTIVHLYRDKGGPQVVNWWYMSECYRQKAPTLLAALRAADAAKTEQEKRDD